jgi:hypothetical protein
MAYKPILAFLRYRGIHFRHEEDAYRQTLDARSSLQQVELYYM